LALVPAVQAMFQELRGASVPVCVSGAGPTLLAFETEGHAVADPGEGWRLIRVAPRRIGVEILEG
jgi:homoserine kinase